MGKYTVIPIDTFDAVQMDAGILLSHFDIDAAVSDADATGFNDEDIICATTGGINPSCVANYSDLGSDVDNCPNSMKELKHLDSYDVKLVATSLGTSKSLIKKSIGCADIKEDGRIVPRADLMQSDFEDLWWVGDKANGGFIAIRIMNALSSGGFSLQTTKNGKGQIKLEFTGHVSMMAQKVVPMEIYSIEPSVLSYVKVSPEAGTVSMFGTLVSDMQSDVSVGNGKITGTLKYLDSGDLVDTWGAGNFIGLKFSNIDENATSVMVGLEPSYGAGLVDIVPDPDKNGAFKITDKENQKFKVVSTDGTNTTTQVFSLKDLVLETE